MNGNDRTIVGLVMVAHGLVHTYELSVPIFVSIWLAEFAVTEAHLGLIVTVGMALFGLGALPAGLLVDRVGSKWLIVACFAGMGASFLLLGALPSVAGIAIALVVWGVAASVYHPAGLSLISTGVTERGHGLALHGAAGNVGIAFGPLVATLLLLAFGWQTVVTLLAVPALVAAPVAVLVDIDERAAVEESGELPASQRATPDGGERSGLAAIFANSRQLFLTGFAGIFAIVVFSGLYYRGMLTFLPELLGALAVLDPVDVAGRTLEPARSVYAALLMVGVGGQYLGGRLSDRIDTWSGLSAAFGALAATTLLFIPASTAGALPLLGVSAVLGFTLFTVQPLYQATVADVTPTRLRGLSYGFMYLAVFGVGALGATVAGALLTYFSSTALFVVLAGFAATASLLGLLLRGR